MRTVAPAAFNMAKTSYLPTIGRHWFVRLVLLMFDKFVRDYFEVEGDRCGHY